MNRSLSIQWLIVLASLPAVGVFAPARACNIPVFRYALENWAPDPYLVFVLHEGPMDEQAQQWVDTLKASASRTDQPANLQVFSVDPSTWQDKSESADGDSAERSQWPSFLREYLSQAVADCDLSVPQIVALFPPMIGRPTVAWQGELSESHVQLLVDSPLRQDIARRLLDGQSAVWVLIESGNEAADQAAAELLQRELERVESELQLPDQSVIESDEFYRPEVQIELRVEFSLERIRRDDPHEAAFVSMLLGSEPDLRDFEEPIAIPIYGRGRTYLALVGKGINAEMIEENCRFICGACSCQVKQENPGIDILMASDWANQVIGTAMPEIALPELTGVGALALADQSTSAPSGSDSADFAASATMPEAADEPTEVDAASDSKRGISDPLATTNGENELPSRSFESSLLIWLLGLVGVGLTLAVVTTLLMRRNVSTS